MKALLALLPALAAAPAAMAFDTSALSGGDVAIYTDNDSVAGYDRDYTAGFRAAWTSDDFDAAELPPALTQLSDWFGTSHGSRYAWSTGLTQLIYTPENPFPYSQPVGERRYAGWLGLDFTLHARSERQLSSWSVLIGTTGSHSLAENSQDLIHSAADIRKFNGWSNQVPNEPTLDVAFIRKNRPEAFEHRFGSLETDAITEWGARLGTFRTAAHAGITFRTGINLQPDFSDTRLSDLSYAHSVPSDEGWSFWFLGGGAVRGIAYDATLDGPVFDDFKTGSKREPFVAEVYAGAAVRYRRVELSYVHTIRSEEYVQQRTPSRYGTLALRYRF